MMVPKDEDLISWDKYPKPVLTQAAHGSTPVAQWRDPFLFREAGSVYMVCGGNVPGGRGGSGQVQLYRATKGDLSEWKHLGAVFNALERDTWNIECPNLFKLQDQWVLIVSPHRPCEYYVGDLDLEKVKFTPYCHAVLDPGDAYASNISYDDKGRVILWLWGRTNTPPGKGWNGVMTLPRILSLGSDGFLRQQPAPEFAALRGAVKEFPAGELGEKPVPVEGDPGDAAEIEAEFSTAGPPAAFGLELRRSAQGAPGVVVSVERGNLMVGNVRAYIGNANRYKLRIFLDKRCIEVYVNDGATAIYNPVDAPRADQGIAVFARPLRRPGAPAGFGAQAGAPPNVRLESLRAWPMRPASFGLERFHV
jgi:beta-fructofuranosidase